MEVGPKQPGNFQELYDVKAALAVFVLGNEGLRLFELVGELLLGHARSLARCAQLFAQDFVLLGVEGFLHGARAWGWDLRRDQS